MFYLAISLLSACATHQDGRPGPRGNLGFEVEVEVAVDPGELTVTTWDLPLIGFARIDHPDRPVVLGVERRGTALCPDCVDLPPEDCPAACDRDVVVAIDEAGRTSDWFEVFPATFDDSVAFVSAATLPDGSALVSWQRCDRSGCGFGLPRDSCDAKVGRFTPEGSPMGPVRALHPGWVGTTRLIAHPDRPEVLALAVPGDRQASAQVAVLDASGAVLLAWTAVGGPSSNGHHAVATPDGFVVTLDDRSPSLDPTGPCAQSCDCAPDWSVGEADAGIDTYEVTVDGVGPRQPRVRSEGRVEVTAAAFGPDGLVVAGVTRDHEVWVDGPDGVYRFEKGSPMWVGALAVDGGSAAVVHDLDGRMTVYGALEGVPFTEVVPEEGIGIEPTTRAGDGSVEALVLLPEGTWVWRDIAWTP